MRQELFSRSHKYYIPGFSHRIPFPYRAGQRDLVVSVYRAISRRKRLFIQAPTGIGKTLSAIFPAVKAGETAYTVRISDGKKSVTLNDVLVGEVWFCSGQSNMQMPVGKVHRNRLENGGIPPKTSLIGKFLSRSRYHVCRRERVAENIHSIIKHYIPAGHQRVGRHFKT